MGRLLIVYQINASFVMILIGYFTVGERVQFLFTSCVTASVSMRLDLSLTCRRSSSLSEPGHFKNALKSGAFSKRYSFIGPVNGVTALI